MNREQMIEMIVRMMDAWPRPVTSPPEKFHMVATILHIILPQVRTVEELDALPENSGAVAEGSGKLFRKYSATSWWDDFGASRESDEMERHFPLTVVWTP